MAIKLLSALVPSLLQTEFDVLSIKHSEEIKKLRLLDSVYRRISNFLPKATPTHVNANFLRLEFTVFSPADFTNTIEHLQNEFKILGVSEWIETPEGYSQECSYSGLTLRCVIERNKAKVIFGLDVI